MSQIHPTAIVAPEARIGADCTIGAYCIVGPDVVLGDGCRLHPHAIVEGHTQLGTGNEIFSFACIGGRSQDLKWKGGITRVRIGDHNVFREYCTVHSATADGNETLVGSNNFFLANTHLAHDVRVGSHVIMSNLVALAGHVTVDDHAVIGGMSAVHQFVRIGRRSMVGGCTKVTQDVAPFMMVDGNPGTTRFINKIGLERSGLPPETISALAKAYKLLFRGGLTTAEAVERILTDLPSGPELTHLVEFVRTTQRGLAR
jgi:UDP-N-acetylglucosamine acyltransferase